MNDQNTPLTNTDENSAVIVTPATVDLRLTKEDMVALHMQELRDKHGQTEDELQAKIKPLQENAHKAFRELLIELYPIAQEYHDLLEELERPFNSPINITSFTHLTPSVILFNGTGESQLFYREPDPGSSPEQCITVDRLKAGIPDQFSMLQTSCQYLNSSRIQKYVYVTSIGCAVYGESKRNQEYTQMSFILEQSEMHTRCAELCRPVNEALDLLKPLNDELLTLYHYDYVTHARRLTNELNKSILAMLSGQQTTQLMNILEQGPQFPDTKALDK